LHCEVPFPTLSINLRPVPEQCAHAKGCTPLDLLLGIKRENASSAIPTKVASYLPTISSSASPDHKSNSYLAIRGSQLELLKSMIGLLSNDHYSGYLGNNLKELTEDPQNLGFLTRLLSIKQDSICAFAEKLLPWAVRENCSPALVSAIISSGADVDYVDPGGETLLGHACLSGNDTVIELLLENGFDVDSQNEWGYSPLYHASACSDEVVSKLLDRGFKYGDRLPSPLDMAKARPEELAGRLIQCAMESSTFSSAYMIGAFIEAAYWQNVDTLDRLARLQPETFRQLKETPWLLFEAAAFFEFEEFDVSEPVGSPASTAVAVMDYLRNHGFDLTAVDEHGTGNPLVYAVLQGDLTLIQYLLDAGAPVHTFANGSWNSPGYLSNFVDLENVWYEYFAGDSVLRNLFANGKNVAPIHAAAGSGVETPLKMDIVQLLLNTGADPNQPGSAYPIQIASWSEKEGASIVETLLNAGAKPNLTSREIIRVSGYDEGTSRQEQSTLPLRNALQLTTNVAVFEALVGAGAILPDPRYTMECCTCEDDIFGREPSMTSPMDTSDSDSSSRSASYTYEEFISSETSHGPDSEACPRNLHIWSNPLYNAAECGRQDLLSKLITILSPLQQAHWLTNECFSIIVRNCDWEFVVHHVSSGTFPNSCVHQPEFFIRAIHKEQKYWVSRLVKEGKMPECVLNHGFVSATQLEHLTLIPIFLEAGCWPDTQGSLWRSPLDVALQDKSSKAIAVFLKHYETNLYRANEPGISTHFAHAYGQAVMHGHVELAKFLTGDRSLDEVEFYGNFSRDSRYAGIYSSLQLAFAFDQKDIIQWLLDSGANPNILNERQSTNVIYHTPLQYAAKYENIKAVRDLIQKGAKVNDTPIAVQGATALQFAAISGNFEMADILLQAGADINAPPCSWDGRSAIDGAAEWGRLDMVCFLLEAGAAVQGRTNLNYRKTIYRAWVHGHRVLANAVQRWKQERYGLEDCEEIEAIVESMDLKTLERYGDPELQKPRWYTCCDICSRCCKS
jgi:ankyrin repeat protein